MTTATKIEVSNGAIVAIDGCCYLDDLAKHWGSYIPTKWPGKTQECLKTLKDLMGISHMEGCISIITSNTRAETLANMSIAATEEYVQQVGNRCNKLYEEFLATIKVPVVLSDGEYEVDSVPSLVKVS